MIVKWLDKKKNEIIDVVIVKRDEIDNIQEDQISEKPVEPLTTENLNKNLKEIITVVKTDEDNETVIVSSDFSIMLSDFKIKRPALLTVKIRNQIDLKVFLVGSIDSQK